MSPSRPRFDKRFALSATMAMPFGLKLQHFMHVPANALSATSFAPLPTNFRTFADPVSHVCRPDFAHLATGSPRNIRCINRLAGLSTPLTYLTLLILTI